MGQPGSLNKNQNCMCPPSGSLFSGKMIACKIMVIDTVELSKSPRLTRVDQACKSEYASQTVIKNSLCYYPYIPVFSNNCNFPVLFYQSKHKMRNSFLSKKYKNYSPNDKS